MVVSVVIVLLGSWIRCVQQIQSVTDGSSRVCRAGQDGQHAEQGCLKSYIENRLFNSSFIKVVFRKLPFLSLKADTGFEAHHYRS